MANDIALEKAGRLAGMDESIRNKELVELRELESFLEQILREARSDLTAHNAARVGEYVSTAVLFVCDATVAALSYYTGGAGTVVGKAYDGGKLIVNATYGGIDSQTGYKMLAKNKAKVAELTLEYGGKNAAAKSIGAAADVVDIGHEIYSWWQENGSKGWDDAGIRSAILGTERELEKIRQSIRAIESGLPH